MRNVKEPREDLFRMNLKGQAMAKLSILL